MIVCIMSTSLCFGALTPTTRCFSQLTGAGLSQQFGVWLALTMQAAANGPVTEPGQDAEMTATPTVVLTVEADTRGFDLDGLVNLSFNPLKGVLEHLLARMERQDAAIAKVAERQNEKL